MTIQDASLLTGCLVNNVKGVVLPPDCGTCSRDLSVAVAAREAAEQEVTQDQAQLSKAGQGAISIQRNPELPSSMKTPGWDGSIQHHGNVLQVARI